ncbi:hypothetical protein BTN50_0030 [Candidatus Enterovibrio altilux]|uniref:Uncharacterized protein n=1 Tax=Candidatus Enterovibrio altilux TaxID=1927128 RepID=A0A291B6F7_9GAMM|nr:hypothetical protein BTN50_0030 [Candidatus Enterovibrio luxaltus]
MKQDMLLAGTPDDNLVLNYAIFDANQFTLVTQAFHCK